MRQLLLLALFVSAASAFPFIGSVQAVRVTGKVTCNGQPAENIKVKLYEKEIVLDKLLDEKSTDGRGSFTLAGNKKELTAIDPHVNIYHKCNYNGVCYKKLKIKIPKSFISEGETADRTFDIGELNLAGSFSGESTDCLN
ncbi:Transthyretin-like family protein [Caenorhabditis elegans]|uniref:Transthyretin-like family protein n=1 Tax=Caenorhabditis elegans TaxID=6239 RepID=Q17473_CAEEL|nr:Transthyretin-like family protein [Caenorhabditis elegans]CAA91371.1 Transthyretin-like family protein [Caenorhabditis elegans]|eukprot:NP_496453.1 TransThyretin-Related family domain [Caenorhabditis elegans]